MDITQGNRKPIYLIITFCLLLSCGCNRLSSPEVDKIDLTPQHSEDSCLPPIVTFEFPVGSIRDGQTPSLRKDTLPSGAWKKQAKLPENFNFHRYNNIVTSSDNDVWLTGDIGQKRVVIRYDQGLKSWTVYGSIEGNETIAPKTLFLSLDGTIWGIDNHDENGRSNHDANLSLLSRYTQETDQFEFMGDLNSATEEFDDFLHLIRIREDQSGNLYLLLYQKNGHVIYRYKPSSQKLDFILMAPQDAWIVDFVIGPNNKIWMVDAFSEYFLISYDLKTGEFQPYQGTISFVPGDDLVFDNTDRIFGRHILLLDNDGKLWVDDRGWLDGLETTSPSWHRIIRSPLFVVLSLDNVWNPVYYWDRPREMYQSSDGSIWFTSYAGIIRLNPDIGDWCLLTTYYSPVTEDDDQNLWLVADEHLYKLDLKMK